WGLFPFQHLAGEGAVGESCGNDATVGSSLCLPDQGPGLVEDEGIAPIQDRQGRKSLQPSLRACVSGPLTVQPGLLCAPDPPVQRPQPLPHHTHTVAYILTQQPALEL